MKVIYMGTPDFAVPALCALHDQGYEIAAVVTQPDKARDRGKKVQFSPVKEKAVQWGTPLWQPEKIKGNEAFLEQVKGAEPDVIIVAAYGKILPPALLKVPQFGCINIHASLLPKYRGAAPIHRCIIEGEKETGITLMYMEEGLDTGDIIVQKETEVGEKTTAQLHDELAQMGAELLIETLPILFSGQAKRVKQKEEEASYAPMVFKQEGLIDFSKEPDEIVRLIRGFNSWPGAHTLYHGKSMKLWEAEALNRTSTEPAGTVTAVTDRGIEVSAGGKTLLLTKIQMPGKKPMQVKEYRRGNHFDLPVVLG